MVLVADSLGIVGRLTTHERIIQVDCHVLLAFIVPVGEAKINQAVSYGVS